MSEQKTIEEEITKLVKANLDKTQSQVGVFLPSKERLKELLETFDIDINDVIVQEVDFTAEKEEKIKDIGQYTIFEDNKTYQETLKEMLILKKRYGLTAAEIKEQLGPEYARWCASCPEFERRYCPQTPKIIEHCFSNRDDGKEYIIEVIAE